MTRYLGQAPASVQLIAESDLRLVGGEPTQAQCLAGAEAGNVSPEIARLVFLAMIAADELSDAEQSSP